MNSALELWLNHPITQTYRKILKEHREGCVMEVFNAGVLNPETMARIAQLKGQVNAFDIMLDTDQLELQLDGELEDDGKEIHSDSREYTNKSI